jgi:hypothetical protein
MRWIATWGATLLHVQPGWHTSRMQHYELHAPADCRCRAKSQELSLRDCCQWLRHWIGTGPYRYCQRVTPHCEVTRRSPRPWCMRHVLSQAVCMASSLP